jgi:hypothetical protein
MNDVVKTETPLYQISFILEGHRYQQDVRMDASTADALRSRLDGKASRMDLQDLQVYSLNESKDRFDAFSALDLLATITEAVNVDLSAIDEDEEPGLEDLRLLADALSASTESADANSLVATQVDFTWDNGGGDDNAFTDGYASPASMVSQREAFEEALSDWLEASGHAYDVCYQEISDDPDDETTLVSGLESLIDTLETNDLDGEFSKKWIKVLKGELASAEGHAASAEVVADPGSVSSESAAPVSSSVRKPRR